MTSNGMKHALNYSNKVILAPMVRVGTLPMRLLALRYGADIVYGQEIIDHKIIQCTRTVNKLLGTIDYTLGDGSIIFRTCEEEKSRLVFQMGTSDPDRALKVAKILENDISGLDINMGCPKDFSIKCGMGAALLTQPEKIRKILTTLVGGLTIPVTCKIRILPELSDTLELVKMIETTGVKALGVHGRWREERSSLPCHYDYIKKISETIKLPVIANGGSLDVQSFDDIKTFQEDTGCSSVMLARAAQWNASVFRKNGKLPTLDVMKDYLEIALQYDFKTSNIKYVLSKMLLEADDNNVGEKILNAMDAEDIAIALDHKQYYDDILDERKLLQKSLDEQASESTNEPSAKRLKEDNYIVLDVIFNRKLYPQTLSPVQVVVEHCQKEKFDLPVFNTVVNSERLFKSEMIVDGKTYTPVLLDKQKKGAKQAAAMVYLLHHNMHDGRLKS